MPVRQWVLSLPYEVRYRLAWDGELVGAVLAVFQRVVHGWYRREAKAREFPNGRCGAVTFVQCFGSALNLNPHLHVLVLYGVYIAGADGAARFVPAPRLTDADVRGIVETIAQRVIRLLQQWGLLDDAVADPLLEREPLLAAVTSASIRGQVATGDRAGQRLRRRLVDPEEGVRSERLCFSSRGFSLHAGTAVGGKDRGRLEQLCRYVMRPPLAAGRLVVVDEETLAFALKTP